MRRKLLYVVALFGATIFQALIGGGDIGAQALDGVNTLKGVNPTESANWITDEKDYQNNTPSKTFFLYNVGTGQFLNMGGVYGTHAALSDTPKYIFIYNNTTNGKASSSTPATTLNLRTKQSTLLATGNAPENSTDFIQYVTGDDNYPGVYVDRSWNNKLPNGTSKGGYGWTIEKAKDANHADAYFIHQTVNGIELYLSAVPNGANGNNCEAKAKDGTVNQEWRFISLESYSALFNVTPANLSALTDASFLIKDPGLSVNNKFARYWNVSSGTKIKLGTDTYYKTSVTSKYEGDDSNNRDNYQPLNGRFFCGRITSTSGEFYQDIDVSRPGWFVIRCKGFSNMGAQLFAVETNKTSTGTNATYAERGSRVTSDLNVHTSTEKSKNVMLQAGKDFAAGKYENQVMLYIAPKEGATSYHIRFGITVPNTNTTSGQTIFDSFRMLYAMGEEPDLVLDEDNFDMNYLTETTDEYKNAVLYLNRKFSLGKWNTIILPVDLTYGQMKRTFGDDVRLARLNTLTSTSIRFVTVEPKSDNDVMLEAYVPYIIKPTKGPGTNDEVTEKLHAGAKESPAAWTGQYKGISVSNGNITVPANHYTISMVTLNRETLPTDGNISNNTNKMGTDWVSTTTDKGSDGTYSLICKGTLAKTYDDNDIISGRDDLKGDFFFRDGSIYQVPQSKQYGLKAFRCWFEEQQTSNSPKTVALYLDGEEIASTSTTAIANITVTDATTGGPVYNLAGQRVGTSLQGLPAGIYIVNGQKMVVR